MAKAILSLFGGVSAFFGVMVIGAAFALRYRGWDLAAAMAVGSSLLLAAGPLLDLAEIIHLLGRIAANTARRGMSDERIEPVFTVEGRSIT